VSGLKATVVIALETRSATTGLLHNAICQPPHPPSSVDKWGIDTAWLDPVWSWLDWTDRRTLPRAPSSPGGLRCRRHAHPSEVCLRNT